MTVPRLPVNWSDMHDMVRRIASRVNSVIDGKTDNYGSFTFPASTATCVVSDRRVGVDSVIALMPDTATAAAQVASVWVDDAGDGEFTVKHASGSATILEYKYTVTG